jgi:hypothetical protein
MAVSAVVEETPGVRRYQVIQTEPATLSIRLEADAGSDEAQVWEAVTARLHAYLVSQELSTVALRRDSALPSPHPKSGKFRQVWAEIGKG